LLDVTDPEVGVTTTVALVPNNGNRIESMEPAAKSWWNSKVIEPDFNPAIDVLKVLPKDVVSCESTSIGSSTDANDVLRFCPLIVTL
jgi:hypothetical protein